MKNTPDSTSFRSVTQATDSALRGWTANSAATHAAAQNRPVIARTARNNSTAASAWSSTLVR